MIHPVLDLTVEEKDPQRTQKGEKVVFPGLVLCPGWGRKD